ncbi:MAG: flagellar protein FliS [Anaerolineae bacterium]|nr:flagellar protein FliS [Anaerolineae bacterium]
MMNAQTALRNYRRNQIMSATPLQLVLMVYDVAIVACARKDLAKVTQALNLLIKSLDMSQGEVALGLYKLYQYCADLARKGDFDQAAKILRELTSAWVQCLVAQGPSSKTSTVA